MISRSANCGRSKPTRRSTRTVRVCCRQLSTSAPRDQPTRQTRRRQLQLKIETLDDLFYEELSELYDEEGRLVDALPKMARNSSSERLRQAFEQHLGQTLEHVHRLERCFHELGKHAGGETANGMKGLIKDGERAMDGIALSPLRDAALIEAAKRVEHYEIAAYTGTISFARLLGHEEIAGLLEQTLQEEKDTDAKLTEIAESPVNQRSEERRVGKECRSRWSP